VVGSLQGNCPSWGNVGFAYRYSLVITALPSLALCDGDVQMIKKLWLKFGRTPDSEAEAILSTPVTVFVGPNNSGKSKVLAEINAYCITGEKNTNNLIFENMEFQNSTESEAEKIIKSMTLQPRQNETLRENYVIVGKGQIRNQVPIKNFHNAIQDPNNHTIEFCQWYLKTYTLILGGENRISLTNAQKMGDLQQPPPNSLRVLFDDGIKRETVRRIVKDAFGNYLVTDPTNVGFLRLKLSPRPPNGEIEEKGLHSEAVNFHGMAQPIEEMSDGVKAFVGIVMEVSAGDPKVLLIDEPEAFLHPALSFVLGKEIAITTRGSEKRIFISTHSAKFVVGCLQGRVPVTIVRLTYRDGVATARILPNDEILTLMRNPLLRSTGVLEGLFYEFVVVGEADADRAFYQEINERLVANDPTSGIPNCLFIHAQNRQTVHSIVAPLRNLGIPTVGIVDIDVLKEGGKVWTNFLASGGIPSAEHQPLGALRANLKVKLEGTGRDMKKDGGVELLSGGDKEAANNLFDKLAEYGLFVVRRGELENWLPQLDVGGHGPDWLIQAFESMGEDPDSPGYLQPSSGDVWQFLGEVRSWLVDVDRKGIPE